jgi:hypothetical protein
MGKVRYGKGVGQDGIDLFVFNPSLVTSSILIFYFSNVNLLVATNFILKLNLNSHAYCVFYKLSFYI